MIVKKVKMASRQTRNLSQGIIYQLGVEAAPACEERVLVAEGAMVGTTT
jgi:hypothetical protein